MKLSPRDLPIWGLHASILDYVHKVGRLVLVAATGSGKTTQVPQMIFDAGLSSGKKIVVLQPRRVAARSVATRVAWERSCKVGMEVGYQVRFEDHIHPQTKICFVTEGILLRWLQEDPLLRDIGVIVFDEFHERNLLSDVALALSKDLQQTRRPDLRLVVMSATLEAEPVSKYLAQGLDVAPILVSEGRTFPVEMCWADYMDQESMSDQAARAVERIVSSGESGDILVFMPGMGEIHSTIQSIRAARVREPLLLLPLHGDLSPEDQDRAFASSDRRKIIVATNVAETSVTIDGVRHVIDSGLARVARYEAERGIQTLRLEEISRASADQRAGRAGRTAPGTCWRLWTESGHLNRPAKNTPEIQRADLAEVVLLLHSLGVQKAREFDWLDKPDSVAVERAERLLVTLGALREEASDTLEDGSISSVKSGGLTEIGSKMLRLPMHPRFSRMLVEASERGVVRSAALCAALVSGRDLLTRVGRDDGHVKEARELFEASPTSDFHTLMRAQEFARKSRFSVESCRHYGIHAQTARVVHDTFQQIVDIAKRERLLLGDLEEESEVSSVAAGVPEDFNALAKCILAGFVDQVAKRLTPGGLDCAIVGGRQGSLARESVVQGNLLVAASIREIPGRTGQITLLSQATAIELAWLVEICPQGMHGSIEHRFDRLHKRVTALRVERFFDLVVEHTHQRETDPVDSGRCLAEAYMRVEFELPNFNYESKQWLLRVNLASKTLPELEIPPFNPSAILKAMVDGFRGLNLLKEAQQVDFPCVLRAQLDPGQQSWIHELAPVVVKWGVEKKLKLTYVDEGGIVGAEVQVKLIECFAQMEHPKICEGRTPIQLILLTPDGKRLDRTSNWPEWRIRSYPKHRSGLQKKFSSLLWP